MKAKRKTAKGKKGWRHAEFFLDTKQTLSQRAGMPKNKKELAKHVAAVMTMLAADADRLVRRAAQPKWFHVVESERAEYCAIYFGSTYIKADNSHEAHRVTAALNDELADLLLSSGPLPRPAPLGLGSPYKGAGPGRPPRPGRPLRGPV